MACQEPTSEDKGRAFAKMVVSGTLLVIAYFGVEAWGSIFNVFFLAFFWPLLILILGVLFVVYLIFFLTLILHKSN